MKDCCLVKTIQRIGFKDAAAYFRTDEKFIKLRFQWIIRQGPYIELFQLHFIGIMMREVDWHMFLEIPKELTDHKVTYHKEFHKVLS
jgi:predicted component of viral defense system (DUF524 family)